MPAFKDNAPAIARFNTAVSFELDRQCTELLNQFRTRTIYSLGAKYVELAENAFYKFACSYPFLMHALLAITALHNRYMGVRDSRHGRSIPATYHASQCITLFNHALSQPVQPEARDPLWLTAALVGIIAFSSIESLSPEESWPLKPSEPGDLDWLNMCKGKMAVWKLTDPLRPNSAFRSTSDEYAQLFASIPSVGIDNVPSSLSRICGLDSSSTAENSPYFTAVHVLAQLQNLPHDRVTMARSLAFGFHMQKSFKARLQEKDPVALLLLALWYQKAGPTVWWIDSRANIEGQSICLYLRRYHKSNRQIQDLLPLDTPSVP
ncbi:uncharacterized protein Z518_00242 [Rhinocladiella mackenziei CBS 650.93]|uniref:Transcription factor domain-containing protein n=1 Tax=Rhinocladiella mackenziei CBS 650.93 TaxID=1442369 RepID=A0A0D2IT16_9EURO|nr:uncharacterized protein Z518_00242 [Rhinocladiella mackenziei CBS 650.93]KIX09164.1 hypothetical protein Z518_00242 [Rhinocladiella mackenziei CBS 650.93]